jgi:hypothetical protein
LRLSAPALRVARLRCRNTRLTDTRATSALLRARCLFQVQYECKYRGIVAVSSREGRLLGTHPLHPSCPLHFPHLTLIHILFCSFGLIWPHFDPIFCATPAGGNRTLAEPFQFKYGRIPEEFTKPRRRKTIVGVGIELRAGDGADAGLFVVADVTAGGPAAKAGVRPLDRVLAVGGALDLALDSGFDSERRRLD